MKVHPFAKAVGVIAVLAAGAVLGRALPVGELGAGESPTNATTVVGPQ